MNKLTKSVKKEKGREKITEAKTFNVPFALEKIKKNLTITTNFPYKTSKEEIINQAFILHSKGKILEAAKYYHDFIQRGFTDPRIFCNFGIILQDLGKAKETFDCYVKTIEHDPNYPNIYPQITRFLRDSNPSELNKSKLKNILFLLLKRNDVRHKELFGAFQFLYENQIVNNLKKLDIDFSHTELFINDKLIINSLKKIIYQDPKWEIILTKLRRDICDRIANQKEKITNSKLELIIALGEQCFLNEYIYKVTEEEKIYINIIIRQCQSNQLNESNISILSCYFPLYKLLDQIPSLKSFHSSNQNIKELIKLQIEEPINENELSKTIKKLSPINDSISQKVKSQYEENPYPRWRHGNSLIQQKPTIAQAINIEIKPNSISKVIGCNKLKVLIAGCGTGNQIVQAQRYKNSQITGIDISLSSLSYAQRKINELGINNVELIQMDILEVSLLKEKFDIIESSGVLHHMNNPSKGLEALLRVLKNNGFMKLGLYSELARQGVVKAREYIANKKIQSNQDGIRHFRETIFSGKAPELNSLRESPDFYTLSSCRDLCFHAKEHRFTIEELRVTLKSNELKFLGFLLPQPIKSIYKDYFPEDKTQTNLQNWERFEEKHPNTFSSMYQFWVCKTKI